MITSRHIAAGCIAITLLGTGTLLASAQTVQGGPGGETTPTRADMRGGFGDHGSRGARREMFQTLFETIDADGDGSVTTDEIDAYRTSRLAEVDASGDGALTIEEFDTLFREFTRPRMVDAFQALDADGDGLISPEEIDTRIARVVERLDRDGDGTLTLQRGGRSMQDDG